MGVAACPPDRGGSVARLIADLHVTYPRSYLNLRGQ
jgi:hypothetical protein